MTNALKSKIAKAGLGLLVGAMMLAGTSVHALTAADIAMLQAAGIISASQAASLMASIGGSTSTGTGYQFTRDLTVGSTGADVKELQKFLNANGFVVSASGAGSVGNESMYFGPATRSALGKYQASKGITPTAGYFGAKTRTAVNGSGTLGGTTPPPAQTGSLSVMASGPTASTLVAGQATATLANFTFTGTGTVTGLSLQRTGVSADTTPSNVYLFDGATRLTDAASVTSNGMVSFNTPSGIFTVNGSKTISVRSDIASGTSGQTLGFNLVSYTAGGATVSASAMGSIHTIASATLATVASGTVTPSGATINPGSNVTLWQSTLTISNRDVWMKRIAFRQLGSAPASAFQNFKLYVNGVQVATAAGIDSMGYVTFDLSSAPTTLAAGSRVVRVDADVVSGASRTVELSVRQAADVDFVDSSFGVNIRPTSTPWDASTALTISGTSGGTLTVQKDVSSPSGNATLGGNDVSLGVFKLTAFGEPVKIETLTAGGTFDGTQGSTSDAAVTLRNGRVLLNGVQYGSTATLVPAGTSYTVNYTVMPGTPVLVDVRADVYDNDGTGALDAADTILAKLIAGSSNATRVDSLGSFDVPSTTTSANTLTVASASITLTKNATYTNQTVVLPTTNQKIGAWNLVGSTVEDVLLTTLSFDVDEVVSTEFDEGDLTQMYVVVKDSNGNIVAQPSPIVTVSATDNNYSINYTIVKNSSVSIELYANLADDASDSAIDTADSFKTDLTITGTSMTSGQSVTATSADTDGQTIAAGAASITAAVAAASPVTSLVYDNQTITSGVFQFTALTSAFTVDDVTLTLPAAGATVVSNVMLYDGATLLATRSGGATSIAFTGINWTVPANTSKDLTVKLQLGSVGFSAGTTGAALTTTLTDASATNVATGVDTTVTESNPAAAAHYAYAAIPVFTQGAVSTTINPGLENEVYKFTITPQGGSVAVKQLKFSVVVTDNVGTNDTLTAGSFKLFRGSTDITSLVDIHNTAGATIESTNTLAEGSTTAIVTWATEEQVSTATEYTLRATLSGFATTADNDSVNITMAYDSSAPTSGHQYLVDLDSTTAQVTAGLQPDTSDASDGTIGATVTTGSNVIWSDMSAIPHSSSVTDDADGTQDAEVSSGDWTNGFLVKEMPFSGMTKFY